MKRTSSKRKIQVYHLRSRLVAFAVCFFLASASLVQAADARIAFMSTRNSDNGEIFLMNPDGKRVRQLTRHLEYDAVPAWSPDGKKITFMSFRDEHETPGGFTNGDIYAMNADGTNPINLTQTPRRHDLDSCWSPDGKQIVFTAFKGFLTDIWVMDAAGGNQRKLTNHEASERDPDWSPDGTRIVFESNRAGDWEKNPKDNWEVFVMNADGTNPINLTNHPKWDSQPSWEPVSTLSVSAKGKLATLWGKVKRSNTYGVR